MPAQRIFKKLLLVLLPLVYTKTIFCYKVIFGDGTTITDTSQTWKGTPITAAFDKLSGNYLFGLNTEFITGNNSAFNISYVNCRTPQLFSKKPLVVTGLATGDLTLANQVIEKVAFAPNPSLPNAPTILVSLPGSYNLYGLNIKNSTYSLAALSDGSTSTSNHPEAIVAIGGGNSLFFAAVSSSSSTQFGDLYSGFAAGTIATTAGTYATTLQIYNPVTGAAESTANAVEADLSVVPDGNYATNEDGSRATTFVYGPASTNPAFPSALTRNYYDLWYDPLFVCNANNEVGRIFVTNSFYCHSADDLNHNSANWGVGIGVVRQTSSSLLVTPTKLYLDQSPAIAITDRYMMGIIGNDPVNFQVIEITKVRTMHTSTGLIYLIFAGGSSTLGPITNDNNVYAIPLVYGSDQPWTNGLPAQPNSFTNGQYTVPVQPDALGKQGADDMISSFSAAALVGGFYYTGANDSTINHLSVPCGPGTISGELFANSCISDMYVDNDAVYVATSGPVGSDPNTNAAEQGVWKSQAIFNNLGQIDHWTDWQKVIPNDMGNGNSGANGSINFAAVDGYTGHIWAVNSANKNAVVTQWTSTSTSTPPGAAGFAQAVNTELQNQCYSVLDLNASTTNWGSETVLRVTLFGGNNKVCFVWTGTAAGVDTIGTITNVNLSDADVDVQYQVPTNMYTLALPQGAGSVIALGYSGWTSNGPGNGGDDEAYLTPGFFLAGCSGTASTPPGLYAYVQDTSSPIGFDPTSLTSFSDIFGPDNGWVRLNNVTGLPTKIMSLGGNLHVLARTVGADRIYTTVKSNDTTSLNNSFVVTALSGSAPNLSKAQQIFDFVISVTAQQAAFAPTPGCEQLLALTTDGVYTTGSTKGMNAAQADLSQTNAAWSRITTPPLTAPYFSDYFTQAEYNRNPQTFHFANFTQKTNNTYSQGTIYNKNIWYQLNRASFDWALNDVTRPALIELSGTLAEGKSYTELPSQTATYNVAQQFNQQTTPTIYYNFPVNARLLYDDGSRRFFIQSAPKNNAQHQVFILPYNAYDYNITSTVYFPKSTALDPAIASASGFYWVSPIGDLGRLTMATNKGLISLQ